MNTTIIKTIGVAAIALFAWAGCSDDLVKSEIDAANAGDSSKLPTVTISEAQNVTFESAEVAASWNNAGDEIIEKGFVYSTNDSFSTITVAVVSDADDSAINTTLSIDSEQTYYVRAYVQTKSNGIAYSNNTNSFTS